MQHNVAKNVLHMKRELGAVAKKTGVEMAWRLRTARIREEEAVRGAASCGRRRHVDKTIYVAWNAMCISAYLEAGRALGIDEAREFALKSLDRVLGAAWDERVGLAHVVAYGETGGRAERVAGVLDDYVFLGHAALDAWETTGEMRYYVARVAADGDCAGPVLR